MSRRQRWILFAILAFTLLTRVGWAVHLDARPSATTSNDSASYVAAARSMMDGSLRAGSHTDEPLFFRTPGYPAFMAGVLEVHDSLTFFLAVQAAASVLIVLVAYLFGARVWTPTVGLVAALLVALEPLQFAASQSLLTESLASLVLVCIAALGFTVVTSEPSAWRCAALGALVGIGALVRPSLLYFPVLVALGLLIVFRRFGWRRALAATLAFVAPVIVLVGGWLLHNHEEAGSWRFSAADAFTLFYDQAAGAVARDQGIAIEEARRELNHQFRGDALAECTDGRCHAADGSRPGPFYDEMFSNAVSVIRDHPVATAIGIGRGFFRGVSGPGSDVVARALDVESSPLLTAALAGFLVFAYAMLAIGAWSAITERRGRVAGHVFALGTALYVVVISSGPANYSRYRGPVMPIVCVYAGFGIVTALAWARRHWSSTPTSNVDESAIAAAG